MEIISLDEIQYCWTRTSSMRKRQLLFLIEMFELRNKKIKFVKVQWGYRSVEEATWETMRDMQDKYICNCSMK